MPDQLDQQKCKQKKKAVAIAAKKRKQCQLAPLIVYNHQFSGTTTTE